jgi:hypothetical protein
MVERVETSWWDVISDDVDFIKAALGVNPQGVAASVAARLSEIETAVASGGGSGSATAPITFYRSGSAGNISQTDINTPVQIMSMLNLTITRAPLAWLSGVFASSTSNIFVALRMTDSNVAPTLDEMMNGPESAYFQLGSASANVYTERSLQGVVTPGENKNLYLWMAGYNSTTGVNANFIANNGVARARCRVQL